MIWLKKQNYGLGHCILGLKVGSRPVKIVQHFCYPVILHEKYIALWPFPTFAEVFWVSFLVSLHKVETDSFVSCIHSMGGGKYIVLVLKKNRVLSIHNLG